MKNILIIGAGRSATACIKYVLNQAAKFDWNVTVADFNIDLAEEKVNGHPNGTAARLDVSQVKERRALVGAADVVVSLLPAFLHLEVGHDCIDLRKHLITASYVSKEMYQLSEDAKSRELIFMGEMGLDPGIDHMSAMQTINEIKAKGAKLTSFKSYTGGLVAPESDTNPWHYKFTWNPRNVVLAGQGTAQYLEDGKFKYIPYMRLFKEHETIDIPGMGVYETYANRDSLLYKEVYGLEDIPTILRGTIRAEGFCKAWNALVQIGLTDDSYPILSSDELTYLEWMEAYLDKDIEGGSVRERTAKFLGETPDSEVMDKLAWMGLFENEKIGLKEASPAKILENLLLEKWKLQPEDKDMILMQHIFEYELEGKQKRMTSTLIMKGHDASDTAMARLVGLPLGIFVKLVMQGKINKIGVNIPVEYEVYEPVLEELKEFGVEFKHEETDV